MNGSRELLNRVLGPTGEDAGCERTFEVLDEYVDHEVAGRSAATLFPDVARHLMACPDCGGDRSALVETVAAHARDAPNGAAGGLVRPLADPDVLVDLDPGPAQAPAS